MDLAAANKRTNGRFIASIAAVSIALAGCSAHRSLSANLTACDAGLQAVCTTFGPARSCECVPRTEVDRFLDALGEPAWLPGAR
jgi:hypothetical protein